MNMMKDTPTEVLQAAADLLEQDPRGSLWDAIYDAAASSIEARDTVRAFQSVVDERTRDWTPEQLADLRQVATDHEALNTGMNCDVCGDDFRTSTSYGRTLCRTHEESDPPTTVSGWVAGYLLGDEEPDPGLLFDTVAEHRGER